MSGQMSLIVFLLLLTLISYSNASFEELETRMNSKFHSMEFILKFHFGRIRQLEEVVISQCAEMNKVKSELAITKKENKDRKQQISSLKKIVLKSAFKHSIGKAFDEMHNKRVHLVKDKRHIKGIQPYPSQVHTTAFYAYISQHLTMMEPNRILVFDTLITNLNGGYSPNTGIFTVAVDGVYVFTFSIRDHSTSFCSYEIIKNAEVVGSAIGVLEGTTMQQHVVGTVQISASHGDVIYVRTHSTLQHKGTILSNDHGRTSFAGWLISN